MEVQQSPCTIKMISVRVVFLFSSLLLSLSSLPLQKLVNLFCACEFLLGAVFTITFVSFFFVFIIFVIGHFFFTQTVKQLTFGMKKQKKIEIDVATLQYIIYKNSINLRKSSRN